MLNWFSLTYKDKILEKKFVEFGIEGMLKYFKYQIWYSCVKVGFALGIAFGKIMSGDDLEKTLIKYNVLPYFLRCIIIIILYFVAKKSKKVRRITGIITILITYLTMCEEILTFNIAEDFLWK